MLTLVFASGPGPPGPPARQQINVWRHDSGEVFARAFTDGERRWIDWPTLGVFEFSSDSHAVRAWATPHVQQEVVTRDFERILQPLILQALGWQALHASAVNTPAGVVAFCGRPGSGKSTLAYALSRANCPQVADDALVLRITGSGVDAHLLPFLPRLREPSREFFSAEHRDVYAAESETDGPRVIPLASIFVLEQNPGPPAQPRMERVPTAQAFSVLLSHAYCFDMVAASETRRLVLDYMQVAERIPTFRIAYRPGLHMLSDLIDAISAAASDVASVSPHVPNPVALRS